MLYLDLDADVADAGQLAQGGHKVAGADAACRRQRVHDQLQHHDVFTSARFYRTCVFGRNECDGDCAPHMHTLRRLL